MKTVIIFLLFIVSIRFSQTAEYGNLEKKSEYENYRTKSRFEMKIGDILTLGVPTSEYRNAKILSEKLLLIKTAF
jgi:hypothetical protein